MSEEITGASSARLGSVSERAAIYAAGSNSCYQDSLTTGMREIGEIADTNPEVLSATTKPGFRFRYVDLSAVDCGVIAWDLVEEVSFAAAPSRARRIVRTGDVLFGTVRPSLQSHGFIDRLRWDAVVASTGFSVIRAKKSLGHPGYLFHCMMSSGVRAQAERDAVGSSYPAVNDSDVRRFFVFAPRVQEQATIARVLDAVDTTIRQTEAIIAKLKQVKQGLLHDLLTRGIDANGELRPPQSEAPHLYKQSSLGWIPKEWEGVRLAERLGVYGGKRLPAGHAYAEARTAYKYLRVTDFYQRGYRFEDLENLHERTFNALQRYEIAPGELCISIAGSLGHVGVHEPSGHEGIRTILTENAARLTPISQMNVHYVAAYMNSVMVQDQIEAEKGTGGGVPKLALFRIEQLWLAWPTHQEQCDIARRVDALDSRQVCEVDRLAKAHALKSGLMDDLLTGRVRVTPLLEATPEATAHLPG